MLHKSYASRDYPLPIMICFCLYLCRMFWGNKMFFIHSFIHSHAKRRALWFRSILSVCMYVCLSVSDCVSVCLSICQTIPFASLDVAHPV